MDIIKLRRDSYENWYNNNPILGSGEVGLVTSSGSLPLNPMRCKVGDGTTNWRDLPMQAWSKPGLVEVVDQLSDDVGILNRRVEAVEGHTWYTVCDTPGKDRVKALDVPPVWKSREPNLRYVVKMLYRNLVPVEVDLILGDDRETVGALYYNGLPVTDVNTWADGEVLDIYFDGRNYMASTNTYVPGTSEIVVAGKIVHFNPDGSVTWSSK